MNTERLRELSEAASPGKWWAAGGVVSATPADSSSAGWVCMVPAESPYVDERLICASVNLVRDILAGRYTLIPTDEAEALEALRLAAKEIAWRTYLRKMPPIDPDWSDDLTGFLNALNALDAIRERG